MFPVCCGQHAKAQQHNCHDGRSSIVAPNEMNRQLFSAFRFAWDVLKPDWHAGSHDPRRRIERACIIHATTAAWSPQAPCASARAIANVCPYIVQLCLRQHGRDATPMRNFNRSPIWASGLFQKLFVFNLKKLILFGSLPLSQWQPRRQRKWGLRPKWN